MKKNSSLVLFVLIAFCSCSKFEKEKIPFKNLDGTVAKSYIAKYAKLSKSFPPDPVSYKPDSLSLKYLELGQELIQEISKKSNVLRVRFYTALDSSDKFLVLMQVAITDKTFFYFDLARRSSPNVEDKIKTAFCPPPDHCDADIESNLEQ